MATTSAKLRGRCFKDFPIILRNEDIWKMQKSNSAVRCFKIGDPMPTYQPGVMRLFAMRYCPYSQRIWLILEHKRISYDLVFIWLKDKCPQWVKDRNPSGQVPILELDGRLVYESMVCAQYLDDLYAVKHRLTPADPYEKARQSMLIAAWDKVASAYHAVVESIEDKEKWDKLLVELDKFEKWCPSGTSEHNFFGGGQPSLVDFAIWPWFERFPALSVLAPGFAVQKDRYPKLHVWERSMRRLPAVKACRTETDTHAAVIATFATPQPDYGYGMASFGV